MCSFFKSSNSQLINEEPTLFYQRTQSIVLLGGVEPPNAPPGTGANGPPGTGATGASLSATGASAATNVSSTAGKARLLRRPSSHAVFAATKLRGIDSDLLRPDLSAQNLALDSEAARHVFAQCQKLCVPMTIVSRHLAAACNVPRALYDTLYDTGSPIGIYLQQSLRKSICQLFRRVSCAFDDPGRCRLPMRCDGQWFVDTFCKGSDPSHLQALQESTVTDDMIWRASQNFPIYNAQLLIAAVPQTRSALLDVEV